MDQIELAEDESGEHDSLMRFGPVKGISDEKGSLAWEWVEEGYSGQGKR
jgi:hypothetical protein